MPAPLGVRDFRRRWKPHKERLFALLDDDQRRMVLRRLEANTNWFERKFRIIRQIWQGGSDDEGKLQRWAEVVASCRRMHPNRHKLRQSRGTT